MFASRQDVAVSLAVQLFDRLSPDIYRCTERSFFVCAHSEDVSMRLSRAEYKEIVRRTEQLRPTRQCMKVLKDTFPK